MIQTYVPAERAPPRIVAKEGEYDSLKNSLSFNSLENSIATFSAMHNVSLFSDREAWHRGNQDNSAESAIGIDRFLVYAIIS